MNSYGRSISKGFDYRLFGLFFPKQISRYAILTQTSVIFDIADIFEFFPYSFYIFNLQKIKIFKTFQRQIWKMISASRINLFTQIIGPLKFDMVTAAMFVFCQLSKHVQAQNKHSISSHVLVHLDCDYMEVDQPTYQTGWEWWKHANSVPCGQKFSRKWNSSFLLDFPVNRPSRRLNWLAHSI